MKRICKDCGKQFELTQGEIDFYEGKGLELPKRCKECRNKNKQNGTSDNQMYNSKSFYSTKSEGKGSIIIKNKSKNFGPAVKKILAAAAVIAVIFGAYSVIDKTNIIGNVSDILSETTYEYTVTTRNNSGYSYSYYDEEETTERKETTTGYVYTTEYKTEPETVKSYRFRNDSLLTSHYQKHGIEMGFSSKEEYEAAAAAVITNPSALNKTEAEDGDQVYFIPSSGEIVFVSGDGYIRTYFITDRDYFDRQ